MPTLETFLKEVHACRLCASHLPHEPRPVVRLHQKARLLITGQATGRRVHASGLPFSDPSGVRLRAWMKLTEEEFYDKEHIAFAPMGLCFPGHNPRGGDRPPVPQCAPLWHPEIQKHLTSVSLTLLVGSYAQRFYLPHEGTFSLTENVRHWRRFMPRFFPLPHPSWRNNAWLKKNPWFEKEVLPELQKHIHMILFRGREGPFRKEGAR